MKKLDKLNRLLGDVKKCAQRSSGMTQNFKAISKTEALRMVFQEDDIPNGNGHICEEDVDDAISRYMARINRGSKQIQAKLAILQLKKEKNTDG